MPSHRRNVIVSILFTVFGGPGIVLIYLPMWITHFRIPASEHPAQKLLAAGLIALGLVPLLDSIRRFIYVGRGTLMPNVPTEQLVASGLYLHVRNPMYVGDLLVLAGEAVLFRRIAMVIYTLVIAVGFHLFILLYEERTLARRHPAEYPLYQANVPRWLPRLTAWDSSQV